MLARLLRDAHWLSASKSQIGRWLKAPPNERMLSMRSRAHDLSLGDLTDVKNTVWSTITSLIDASPRLDSWKNGIGVLVPCAAPNNTSPAPTPHIPPYRHKIRQKGGISPHVWMEIRFGMPQYGECGAEYGVDDGYPLTSVTYFEIRNNRR
jgi:hypothetical protein